MPCDGVAECQADLAEAIPLLAGAIKALNTLKSSDITEVKAMKTPPGGVVLTMHAICVMMKVKPDKIKDPEGVGGVGPSFTQKLMYNKTKMLMHDPLNFTYLKQLDDYFMFEEDSVTKRTSLSCDIVLKVSR